jgi:hypothetical protein
MVIAGVCEIVQLACEKGNRLIMVSSKSLGLYIQFLSVVLISSYRTCIPADKKPDPDLSRGYFTVKAEKLLQPFSNHAMRIGTDPQILLLRLRGGIRMEALAKNNDISEMPSELMRRVEQAAKEGEDSENWTDDSSAKDRLKR